MNVLEMLEDDHRQVDRLLTQLMATPARQAQARQRLLDQVDHALTLHTRLEEEVFYPAFGRALADASRAQAMVAEAREEHRAVCEQVLPDLRAAAVSGAAFKGRAKVLKELVDHHVREEEDGMFPLARQAMDAGQLEALGQQMAQRRAVLEQAAGGGPVPSGAREALARGAARLEAGLDRGVEALARDPVGLVGQMAQAMARSMGRVGLEIGSGVRRGLAEAREARDRGER